MLLETVKSDAKITAHQVKESETSDTSTQDMEAGARAKTKDVTIDMWKIPSKYFASNN